MLRDLPISSDGARAASPLEVLSMLVDYSPILIVTGIALEFPLEPEITL
jgi:hypothetical protein